MRLIPCAVLIGLLGIAQAQASVTILRHEPGRGRLPAGQTVLVDDGSCPKGQVMEVKAGSNRSLRTSRGMVGRPRMHRCIQHP